jgi:hypothetical protein
VVVVDRASIADFKDQALAPVLGDNTADRLGDVAGRCHRQKPPPGVRVERERLLAGG